MENSLSYPIGKYSAPEIITADHLQQWQEVIRTLPSRLRKNTEDLNDAQLDTPYREGGWTIRQVVHHLADSHMNSYIRFKLALTEDNPTIRPYMEERWAELPEAKYGPIGLSLPIIESIHQRWVAMIDYMQDSDWQRSFFHPETKKVNRLDNVLGIYAWHSEHHLAHITELRRRMSW